MIHDCSAEETEAIVERVSNSHATARLCRTLRETLGFLDTAEMQDVNHLVVYEAWLVHRGRAIVRNEPIPTFEDFLISFLQKKATP